MSDATDRPAPDKEIEITPQMIEAGEAELLELADFPKAYVVERVFLAMALASRRVGDNASKSTLSGRLDDKAPADTCGNSRGDTKD
jgi:hypothetical protein